MRRILDAVNKRALRDQVSFGLTLVVHLGCSCCLMFGGLMVAIFTGCISNLCSKTVH